MAELERNGLFLLDLEWKIFHSSAKQRMFLSKKKKILALLVKAKGIWKGGASFTKGFQRHLQEWAENGR